MTISMAAMEIFKNERFGEVRVTGTSEQPLFCASDLCRALGYANGRDAISKHVDAGDVAKCDTLTASGMQSMTYVNESGLYALIFSSKQPNAKEFKRWVTSEVLPSIRKTGSYSVPQQSLPQNYLEALKQLVATEEEKQRLALENKKQAEQIEADAPRVLFSKAVETAKRSCLIAELAKILQQNGINIGQNRLFKYMRDKGYLCSKGQYYNQPTQKAMEQGLFEIKQTTINKPDGSVLVSTTTKVTGKGQVYFVNKILKEEHGVI